MSQCTDVDAALARLEAKIDAQNKQISDLKNNKQDKNKNPSAAPNKGYDDKELRLRIEKIERYINKLDADLKVIHDIVNTLTDGIKGFLAIFDNLFQNVATFFGILK
ncbi:hypothetical protein Cylst_2573 [Cylindrospermum stagnale PCC 7417]|uniref:Uncharacterized protein n=1 Tax=Cylindrospermum stagnale PCC 7417 TaxID=56107 RepID=K9WY82_9NOST|nr:hypothetical protein [Cylindrospermum stagnale]AFZ24779.1 hypothetical protein Cylst_2573 [Cylindrospermum stagnale PCC 7417]